MPFGIKGGDQVNKILNFEGMELNVSGGSSGTTTLKR